MCDEMTIKFLNFPHDDELILFDYDCFESKSCLHRYTAALFINDSYAAYV